MTGFWLSEFLHVVLELYVIVVVFMGVWTWLVTRIGSPRR